VERDVFLILGGAVVWHGRIGAPGGEAQSARERFEEAWRRALQAGAVTAADAGAVQFRSITPDVSALRKVALRAVSR
jgi:hypothetical protein